MTTFACVLRSGGDYTAEWVRKLSRAVGHYAPRPHRFVCVSDTDVPCERIALEHDWPGWWSKVELFRHLTDGPVVYLDLDTLVMGDLAPLCELAEGGGFWMLSDLGQPKRAASGVMVWNGDHSGIHDTFVAEPPRHVGRMDYWLGPMAKPGRIQARVSGIYSYKYHAKAGPPSDAMLVCGHGRPRFSDPMAGWAYRYWEAL